MAEGEGTEILIFCYDNQVELLKEALLHGVDPSVRDSRGRTGLHFSAMHGHVDALRVLLEAGVEASVTDSQGNTPLHMCGHVETIHTLIEFGGRANVRNSRGDTPLALMGRRGVSDEALQLMARHEAASHDTHVTGSPVQHEPPPRPQPSKLRGVRNIWHEFCEDLGMERLALLLLLVLALSLYVAYTITGYARMMDNRIPVQSESQRVEL